MAKLNIKGNRPTNPKRIGHGHWRLKSTASGSATSSWSLDGNEWFHMDGQSGEITIFDVDIWVDDDDTALTLTQIPINSFVGVGAGHYKGYGSIFSDSGANDGGSLNIGGGGTTNPPTH